MKFKLVLKKKELHLETEAGVEKLIEKGMDQKAAHPERKTRYQIRQEEKRKNAELKHKQTLTMFCISMGFLLIIMAICLVMAIYFK